MKTVCAPFYPCQEQTLFHKNCYLYAPTYYLSLYKNDYTGVLRWCEKTNFLYKSVCAKDIDSQTIKENINDAKSVEEVCMSNKLTKINPCIDGMVSLLIYHYGSLKLAEKICEQLESQNRKTCYSSVKINRKTPS